MGREGLLFMQEKGNGTKVKSSLWEGIKKFYFTLYVVGVMFYGMGSYLFLNGIVTSRLEDSFNRIISYGIGVTLVSLGVGLFLYLFYLFYRKVSSKKKVRRALKNYLLVMLLSGVLLGLLGEMLYRTTEISYEGTKRLIWILTTYIQGSARFIFLYYCLENFLNESFCWKNRLFRQLLLGVFFLLSISIGIRIFLPSISPIVMFLTDIVISIGIVYKELFQSKKRE